MSTARSYIEITKDVRAAQQDDAAALDRLLADVQDPVYYTCLKVLHSETAAEDATQEILLNAIRKIKTLKNPAAYIGWVNRITANYLKTLLSKKSREVFLQEDESGRDPFAMFEQVDVETVPEKALDNAETKQMIVDLVSALPDEQRMCVMLYYYDRMKTREIADALDVSEGTVKSRLNYARKTLKEGVERCEREQGINLHGLSPIPFIGYYLRQGAAQSHSPITAEVIRAAAKASSGAASGTAAAGTGAAATTVAAVGGSATGTVIGRIVAGVLALGLLAGVGFGIYQSLKGKPPRMEEEVFAEETPLSVDPEETPIPAEPVESDAVQLYGRTYYQGLRLTVDQSYQSGDMILVAFENDERSFAADMLTTSLQTSEGTFSAQTQGLEIAPSTNGTLELRFPETAGEPQNLILENLAPLAGDGFADASGEPIVIPLYGSKRSTVEELHIAGEDTHLGLTASVDQTYTENGMGKIVLRVENSENRILFSDSTLTLTTDSGAYTLTAHASFAPNTTTELILYFDNAEGTPEQLSVASLSALDAAQNVLSDADDQIVIDFIGTDETVVPVVDDGTLSIPAPAAPTAAPTAEPTAAPTAEPTWSEWSEQEPPEGTVGQFKTQYCYRYKSNTKSYTVEKRSYAEVVKLYFEREAQGYDSYTVTREVEDVRTTQLVRHFRDAVDLAEQSDEYDTYTFEYSEELDSYIVTKSTRVVTIDYYCTTAFSAWTDESAFTEPGPRTGNERVEVVSRTLWRYYQ